MGGSRAERQHLSSAKSLATVAVHRNTVAQRPPAEPQMIPGNQILLNGRAVAGVWRSQQGAIEVSDATLTQLLGVSLLDTRLFSQQPVQWFSEPTQTRLNLSARLDRQYRYLNIADLVQNFGWRAQLNGSTLQLNTPATQVTGVRQGKQSWGDRIVVDLNGPAPWQITEQNGEFAIGIEGTIDPAIVTAFKGVAGNRVTSIRLERSATRTVVRMGVPPGLRPRVYSLPSPNRIVADVRYDALQERNIQWAPGLRWRQQYVNIGSTTFPVVMLELDLRQSGLRLRPVWANPNGLPGISPLITIAQGKQVAGAINAGFFNRETQFPLGAIRQDRRWVSGPILNRGAIAWNDAGEFVVGRLSLQETVTPDSGQQFPVLYLNSGFVSNGIARYTSEWGATYTPVTNNEIIVTVQNDQVVGQQPGGAAGRTTFPIPVEGYLLVIRGNGNAAFPIGSFVERQLTAVPANFNRFPQIIGAGPLLIQNRQIVLNPQLERFSDGFIRQSAVRSAIATTPSGTVILVATQPNAEGRGATLGQMAQIMQQLGSIDALNLDGGSSTSLYLGGQLVNRSPRTAARVHNGIGILLP